MSKQKQDPVLKALNAYYNLLDKEQTKIVTKYNKLKEKEQTIIGDYNSIEEAHEAFGNGEITYDQYKELEERFEFGAELTMAYLKNHYLYKYASMLHKDKRNILGEIQELEQELKERDKS